MCSDGHRCVVMESISISIIYLYCALLSKGRHRSSYNKGFSTATNLKRKKYERKQQNYTAYTISIIIIL